MLKTVRDQVVTLAKSASHEQVPALYDQSIGEFYFTPGGGGHSEPDAAPARAAPAPSAPSIHVATSGELDQSFWDRIKDSTDPADFNDYKTQFPKGSHVAEASLMARRLTRAATPAPVAAVATPSPGKGTAPANAPSGRPSFVGGPYPGYLTSALVPGVTYRGTITVNPDGTSDYVGSNGDRSHGTTDFSDLNNVRGTSITKLGKQYGLIQNHYPDGSTSTEVRTRGRVVNGIFEGQYTDKYQTGFFHFDMSSAH
jgi:hypothetical protein